MYAAELFETNLRGFAISFALTVGKVAAGCATYIILLMNFLSLNPMGFVSILALLSLICSTLLPETKGREIKN